MGWEVGEVEGRVMTACSSWRVGESPRSLRARAVPLRGAKASSVRRAWTPTRWAASSRMARVSGMDLVQRTASMVARASGAVWKPRRRTGLGTWSVRMRASGP
ncbi:hypothetical protein BBK82_22870 [Lentzea guizhouensis]|uniref:Uncharacterized protein n=1 Tax=Lentzea guizhouensis TaxID=1586287 RepID=A0A1B2HL79_9PSEU|nr:hypothetical protein BBK82_22870 [Lentzea guizhouensis]